MAMLFYSPKRSAMKRRKRIVLLSPKTLGIGLLLISLFVLLFWGSNNPDTASSPFSRFVHAPVSAIQGVRNFCSGLSGSVRDNFDAKTKLANLRKENDELRQENQELRYRLRRHEHYREAFDLPQEEGMPVVKAIVLIRDNRMTRSLIINRGTDDGLDVNMPVLTNVGLVGLTTRKISRHAAQVQPLTDPRSGIGVYVKNKLYEGVLRGTEDGKNLLLTDLFLSGAGDETLKPAPGDKVLTSGHGIFPRDIMAGIVSDATTSIDGAYVVEPVVNSNAVKAVMVLTRTQIQDEMLSLLNEN